MTTMSTTRFTTPAEIAKLSAYTIEKQTFLHDINSDALLLRHKKSGARVLVMPNADDNKVFYIGFRTTPTDSTGVAHIIEHTVLCGSRDFPIRDPFIELVKGSLNTFLNAMTYPDKTVYPVASCNERDFRNLMHVYLDAVFYPNIYRTRHIFEQEGWHYEPVPENDPETGEPLIDGKTNAPVYKKDPATGRPVLTVNGVVYNEMKGVMSSPDDVLAREMTTALYPHTTYANESGGDPQNIPDLTYEAYLDFHRRYYHPSNSYIYLYGDMDMVERLTYLDEAYLSHFDVLDVNSHIDDEPAFTAPVETVKPYSIMEDEEEQGKTMLAAALSLPGRDPELDAAFKVLDYVLCDAEGAPLKKALLAKGIGTDVSSVYENGLNQPIWSITARFTEADKKDEFRKTIREVLEGIVRDGFDHDALLAGINYHEFRYREADFGSYPKGLVFGLSALDTWLYDENEPWQELTEGDIYQGLRTKIGSGYFTKLVQQYFLDNPHRATVVLVPEKGLSERIEQENADKIAAYANGLSDVQLDAILKEEQDLRVWQQTPADPADIAKIPLLSRSDLSDVPPLVDNRVEAIISKEPVSNVDFESGCANASNAGSVAEDSSIESVAHADKTDQTEKAGTDFADNTPVSKVIRNVVPAADGNVLLVRHEEFTDGINYVSLQFDLADLPQKYFALLPVYKTVFSILSTKDHDYAALSNRIDIETGGLSCGATTYQIEHDFAHYKFLFDVSVKALQPSLPAAFDLITEIITRTDFTDTARIREVLEEEYAGMTMDLQSSGHVTAATRAESYFSETSAISDAMGGIDAYHMLRALLKDFDDRKTDLVRTLQEMNHWIFRPDHFVLVDSTGTEADTKAVAPLARELYEALEQYTQESVTDAADSASAEVKAASKITSETGDTVCNVTVNAAGDMADDMKPFTLTLGRKNEGFETAGRVNYVCRAGNFKKDGLDYTGAFRVLKVIMGYTYLWDRIRVKGGAYGCMSGFGPDGDAMFVTYRDPHIVTSIKTFEAAADYVRNFDADERAMTQYVIGAMSSYLRPMTPSTFGRYSLANYFGGRTDEDQKQELLQVLNCTQKDIRALAAQLDAFLSDECLCVVGSAASIEMHKKHFDHIEKLA